MGEEREAEGDRHTGCLLPHGYTNQTRGLGPDSVKKTYTGFDGLERVAIESACLSALRGRLPVPRVLRLFDSHIVLERLPGKHGQDLINVGRGYGVMRAAGTMLRELQAIDPGVIARLRGDGDVVVHGDFGPQNMLFDDAGVTALLDWEFAHRGDAVEDVAWAEWIVRMHHAGDAAAIGGLSVGYGHLPPWDVRHAAMLDKCRQLLARCARQGQQTAMTMWAERIEITERWEELPRSHGRL